jgi:C4-dicarboxylate-specific signal transduction histidine kinase
MTKQKILIVDDESRNQRILAEVLENFEFKITSSGEEALQVIEEYLPDLVLLDIMMPGIDGYEVCKKIRLNPHLTHTKVILVSGKAMLDERLKGYECGADDYMTKPFMPEELLAKTKVFLRLTLVEKELSSLITALDQKVQEKTKHLMDREAQLLNSAKMSALGEMAGGIAHEINTPLGTLGLASSEIEELINEPEVDRSTIAELAKISTETVKRISLIIQGLRTFSRDGSVDTFNPAQVKYIIETTLALCKEKIKNSKIKLEVGPIPEDLTINCQAVQISQILLNLISNACDAVEGLDEQWIKVAVEFSDDQVHLSVADSGPGIKSDIQNKIFQPFFTTKDIGKGTGIGLSISQGIANQHNGTLMLNPNSKNTQFVLSLPTNIEKAAVA